VKRTIFVTLVGLAVAASLSACGDAEEQPTPPKDRKLTRAQLIERVRPAIAKVFVETRFGEVTGSAVAVAKDQVLTSAHVVEGASTIELRFSGTRERISARVVGRSLCPDLALLELDDIPADGLKALPFADSAEVEIGDTVAVLGFEANARYSGQAKARVAFGTVGDKDIRKAALGPEIGSQGELILTDATVNDGSSGGPIVTEDGKVAAITTLKGGGEGQGYGIQADVVRAALPDLEAGESGTGLQTIPVRSISDLLVGHFVDEGFTRDGARAMADLVDGLGGLFVLGVDPGSPADRRGLEFGDVVQEMNGLAVNNQTKHCNVLDSSRVVKVQGYHLLGDWSDFTRRLAVK
jgi:S1-C subfamily serine protease